MGFRSSRTSRDGDAGGERTQRLRHRSQDRSTAQHASGSGRLPVERVEEQFGIELSDQETADRLQQLAADAPGRVQQWVDEGMPVDVMGDPQAIQAFRQRQEARPPEVPTSIERQNARSVQRSTEAASDTGSVGSTQVPECVRDVVSSPGQSLDASIRRAMEERMGEEFGDVRIHTGAKAAAACDSIDARAFTVGNHVAFDAGEYDPSSPEGQHVLAHELAHVRQQAGGIQRSKLGDRKRRLREFAARSDDAPKSLETRPELFEDQLQGSLEDIEGARGPALTEELETGDVSRFAYVETDGQTNCVVLPNTQKWDERLDPAAVSGWRHVVARHVSNDAEHDWMFEKSDSYPVTPGESATDKRFTTLWDTRLTPTEIKDAIMEAVRLGEVESTGGRRTFVWDVSETRRAHLGAEQITVHTGEDGMIESAYPSGSLAEVASESDTP